MFRSALAAIGFLTILPFGVSASTEELKRSPGYFPAAGILEGLLLVGTAYVFSRLFGAAIASGLLIAVHAVFTGGLHLDGLSDTFDAIALRGPGERKLEVMKDSTAGPIGVSAMVIAVLLKFLFLEKTVGGRAGYAALFLMAVSSRWAMVMAMLHGKSARESGLGFFMISNTTIIEAVKAAAILAAAWGACLPFAGGHGAGLLASIAGVYLFSFFMVRLCAYNFGGLTGDNLGAISELSEIIFLASFLAAA